MEAGAGWFVNCIERLERAWNSHVQHDPRGRFLKLREKESVTDYIKRHVDEDRIYVGVEGDELIYPSPSVSSATNRLSSPQIFPTK